MLGSLLLSERKCVRRLLFFTSIPVLLFSTIGDLSPRTAKQTTVHRVMITLPTPKNNMQHNHWNKILDKKLPTIISDFITQNKLSRDYHLSTGPQTRKERQNSFAIRHHENLGYAVVDLPKGSSKATVNNFIRFAQKKLKAIPKVIIKPDAKLKVSNMPHLEGMSLSLNGLERLKSGELIPSLQKDLKNLQSIKEPAEADKKKITDLRHRIGGLQQAKQVLFWYQKIPTTGLRNRWKSGKPPYPFIPHHFTLWQLAPSKGKGIKVAVLDTGVAAFTIASQKQFKKNIDLKMIADFGHDTFNMVGKEDIDPLEQLVYQIKKVINPKQFDFDHLMHVAPVWIKTYLISKKDTELKNYLIKFGLKKLVAKGTLSAAGQKMYTKLLKIIDEDFHLVELEAPIKEQVIKELLPLAPIGDTDATYTSGHGSHTFGLVGGLLQGSQGAITPDHDKGICGLAPDADVLMFKVFDENGESANSVLTEAAKRAIAYDVDILNMSLKVTDKFTKSDEALVSLNRMLDLIPYVVSASGNDGDPKSKEYAGRPALAYPAKFDSVEFDVGAFGMSGDGGPYDVSFFSQFEPNVGPKFVAPGYNILSSGLIPDQKDDSVFLFINGTSMAAPIVTGFVALVLGEFKDEFTRDQLLHVCYSSVVRLYDTHNWNSKALLGVIDMRLALFTLHVLKQCKKTLAGSKTYDFETHFGNILEAIRYVLYADPNEYANKHLDKVSMQNDFMRFVHQSEKRADAFRANEYYVPSGWNPLSNAIKHVADSITNSIALSGAKKTKLQEAVQAILFKKDVNMYAHLHKRVQKRIGKAFQEPTFWHSKVDTIRKSVRSKAGK